MKKIKTIRTMLQRPTYTAMAAFLLASSILLAVPISDIEAVQLTSRSVQMSDSGASGNATIPTGVGSGTFVAYDITFSTTSTSTAIGGIVVDFCSNTPLIGDSCTAPAGFNANSASLTATSQTGLGAGTFAVSTAAPQANRVILTRATPAAPSGTGSIELGNGTNNGMTNPNSVGAFFARIYTYPSSATATSHNTASPSGYVDYGGVALRTANVISITARVQESLIFCVFGGAAPNNNCVAAGGSTTPALTIGHQNGGSGAYFIDGSAVDSTDAFMQLSTNAGLGAVVNMRTSTSGGLVNGSNSIPPVNSGSASPGAITAGTAAFGLIVFPGTGTFGSLTPTANYYDATHDTAGEGFWYGMDNTTSGNNVATTYGDTIASTGGAVSNNMTCRLTFAATASNVTPAGLYTANLALIATGTF